MVKSCDNIERKMILEYLNIENDNLLAINLTKQKTKTPHIIFYDDVENEIVVSFRGTKNHKDAIIDLNCAYSEFFDGFSHGGILFHANYFLEKHLSEVIEFLKIKKTKNILLTGHSLGGAAACLIYITLKENKMHQDLNFRVVSFSSPPILSSNICKNYPEILNFVFENDIIPRLSFGSALDLKFLAVSVSKESTSNDFIVKVQNYLIKKNKHPKLYLPGKILHILKKGEILERDNFYFNYIIAHKSCISDHLPSALLNGLFAGLNNQNM
ncbi:hypothetical protein GVAV_001484 [Gurleya vavrai]